MVWLFLILAIVLEVGAALSLRLATDGWKLFYIAVVVGYLGAFFFLTQVLALGLGIGVAYGIWAATGVALTAIASKFLFGEPFTKVMAGGIALEVLGLGLHEGLRLAASLVLMLAAVAAAPTTLRVGSPARSARSPERTTGWSSTSTIRTVMEPPSAAGRWKRWCPRRVPTRR